MKNLYKPSFLLMPYDIVKNKNLSPMAKRVFSVIFWFTQMKNRNCTADNNLIAEVAVTTPRTARKCFEELEAEKIIKRIFLDKGQKKGWK
jgi:hypothetical protein